LHKLAKKFNALTDAIPRTGPADKLLLNADLYAPKPLGTQNLLIAGERIVDGRAYIG
jgi:hypothetical protein